MLDSLTKYKLNDHFFFEPDQNLRVVCNAPTDKSGVYVIFALTKGKVKLYYIGCSGKLKKDGTMFVRKAGLGGIKDRIVNGHQFGKRARKYTWPLQMIRENIEALDVYWYVTHDKNHADCPQEVENKLLQMHIDLHGRLPNWNKELQHYR